MRNQKKSKTLIIVMIIVSVIGLFKMIIFGNRNLIIFYILLLCISLPTMYFNYSLCKSENKWQNFWTQKDVGTGEPSELRLAMGKFSEWLFFIVALILALV